MNPALLALVAAIFLRQPITVPMVEATGTTVTVGSVRGGYGGWVGCSEVRCEMEIADLGFLPHEACHVADFLSDGKGDGLIAGWNLWAGDYYAVWGDYANDAERLGYWCDRQPGLKGL